jgi:hypothetical protein
VSEIWKKIDLLLICIYYCNGGSFIENDDPKTQTLRAKCPSNKKEGKRDANHKWGSSSIEDCLKKIKTNICKFIKIQKQS